MRLKSADAPMMAMPRGWNRRSKLTCDASPAVSRRLMSNGPASAIVVVHLMLPHSLAIVRPLQGRRQTRGALHDDRRGGHRRPALLPRLPAEAGAARADRAHP